MILYASQRANAAELAKHLLNTIENDHVAVHEIRGFVSDDLTKALREAYAMSRGTRCKQFLFSLSLSPPEYADVPIETFEKTIEETESKLGLTGQPRIIVFHEKKGRRHCHAVWSRINTETMTAINMAHFKRKLMDISRFLYLEHGWTLPKGMERGQDRSPWHLTREEYRQAIRLSEDPQVLKKLFKGAWERSDSKETFARALEECGFLLARGDKRGFVAIDLKGGIYSLTRWLDIGTRELKGQLGAPEDLPDPDKAQAFISARMTENLQRFIIEAKQHAKEKRQPLVQQVRALTLEQRIERLSLAEKQQLRWMQENQARSSRIYRGVRGIWQRATGAYKKIRALNETEAREAINRDKKEFRTLVRTQILERQELQKTVNFYREEHRSESLRIRQEIARYITTAAEPMAKPVIKTDKLPIAEEMARLENLIISTSGDIASLQVALESNLISGEMRARVRRLIEKALEALHIKNIEKQQEEQLRAKEEYAEKQKRLNEFIRRYAELQIQQEEETRRMAVYKQFYTLIMNMSCSLNGIPQWSIKVMLPPPDKRLDEKALIKALRQQSDRELLHTVLKRSPKQPIDPSTAVSNLRTSVLEVKEVLRRAGIGSDNKASELKPLNIKMDASKMTINFNTQRGLS